MKIEDKVAVVTGAGSGIGQAVSAWSWPNAVRGPSCWSTEANRCLSWPT